jgi:hypothetical protein
MTADPTTPPVYRPNLVEAALLAEVVDLHPARLTVHELSLKVAADPHDRREIETITDGVRELRRCGLLRYRNDDEVVEPTQAALHAVELLTP